MSNVYLYGAPSGFPGSVTRVDETNVEPVVLVSNGTAVPFPLVVGLPMVFVPGGARPMNGTDAVTAFAGVLIREVPASGAYTNAQTFGALAPNPILLQGIAVRGYVNVKCGAGTPVRGQAVYANTDAGTLNGSAPAFAASAGAGFVQLTNVTWAADGKDASGIAEIRIAQ